MSIENKGNKPPKILFIAPLPPPVHGSAMMTQYIKDSKVINESFKLDWVNLSASRRMDEIGKKSFVKLFRFTSAYFKTFWKLLTNRYKACYIALTCHGIGFLKDAPFALMCKMFGRKLIIHQHNKGMSKDVNKKLYKKLFNLVYRNSSVILLSWRLYPDIEKVVDKDKVFICPNGIPEVPRLKKIKNTKPRILFLSNLMKSKGVFTLLDSCKILKDLGYKYECRFIGGETKEIDRKLFQEEVSKRGLEALVKYVGKKYNDEKYEEISNADVFVFPTLNETFGLVILEAMQQGVPVISTAEGGIPDIITDNETGLIVKSRDSNSLAQAIAKLFDNPEEIKRLGENGYVKYNNEYTLSCFEQTFLTTLKAQFVN